MVKNLPNLLWIKKAFGLLDNECSLLSVESKRCEAAAEELANDGLWWCKLPFLGPHKQTCDQKSALFIMNQKNLLAYLKMNVRF